MQTFCVKESSKILTNDLKGVDKKTNLAAYFPQSVAVSRERSSEKNNLSKIEKTGGHQRAFGPLALAPCFFNF